MADVKKIIKDLGAGFGDTDESKNKVLQLFKGLMYSDDKQAQAYFKQLDKATTQISKEILNGETDKKKENTDLANKLILSEGTIITIDNKDYQIEVGDEIICEKELKEAMQAFAVYLGNKKIDTVFYDDDMSIEDVKNSLITHDGYDARIEVSKERM